jgi:transposase
MEPSHRRRDISDNVWGLLEPRLFGRKGTWGGNARDNRQFTNAMFWILRTGAPWGWLMFLAGKYRYNNWKAG